MSIYNYNNFDPSKLNSLNSQKQQDYRVTLSAAISRSDTEGVKKLLEEIGEKEATHLLNAPNQKGETALHLAVSNYSANVEMVELLLKNGANVQAKNEKGQTPLELAVTSFNPIEGIVATLIDHGASVNATDSYGNPLLHLVINTFNPRREIISLFIKKGADIHILDSRGRTAFELAMQTYSPNPAVIGELIAGGADINQKLPDGNTYLHKALFPLNFEMAKLLIEKGIDVNARDSNGFTPLELAIQASSPDLELIRLLIKNKADVDDKTKSLLLKRAVDTSHVELAKLLFENGIKINAEELDHHLFSLARKPYPKPNMELVELLIKQGANPDQIDKKGVSCSWLLKAQGWKGHSKKEDYNTEYEFRKLLANLWGLKGSTELEGHTFELEGISGSAGMSNLLRLFEIFKDDPSLDIMTNLNPFSRLLQESVENGRGTPEEIQQKFKEGAPISFATGWQGHTINVVFFKNYMMVCNRGAGRDLLTSTRVFKIDRNKPLQKSDIEKIQSADFFPQQGINFFSKSLPMELGHNPAEQDFLSDFLNQHFQQKNQKIGNCWWVSPKASIFALFAMSNIEPIMDLPFPNKKEICESTFKKSQTLYKQFSDFTRIQILKEYLVREPDTVTRDHALVERIEKKKNERKNWNYSFEESEIQTAFESYRSHYK